MFQRWNFFHIACFTYRFDGERSLLAVENFKLDIGITFAPAQFVRPHFYALIFRWMPRYQYRIRHSICCNKNILQIDN